MCMNTTVFTSPAILEKNTRLHITCCLDCCDHMLHTTFKEARGNHKEVSVVLYLNIWALFAFNKAP